MNLSLFKHFRLEPVLVLYLLNAALAVGLSFGLGLTKLQDAAAVTIATAGFGLYAAFRTRPMNVSVITATFAAGLTAAAAFGLHLSVDRIGVLTAFVSAILAVVLRVHVSPVNPPVVPVAVKK